MALITKDSLYVANVGDSKCVLAKNSSKGKLVGKEMNKEATPDKKEEKERILNAGGHIKRGRVEGNLNLSRALGDHGFKDNP